jgi:CheY-like chemotaxis protein
MSSYAATPPECHRVLVVDEWLSLRSVIKGLTQKYALTTLSLPSAALKRIELGESWDAILAFIIMPEMSGFEFFRRMRQTRPDLAARLVLMTEADALPHLRNLQSKSRVPIVTKPADPETLLCVLSRAARSHS